MRVRKELKTSLERYDFAKLRRGIISGLWENLEKRGGGRERRVKGGRE